MNRNVFLVSVLLLSGCSHFQWTPLVARHTDSADEAVAALQAGAAQTSAPRIVTEAYVAPAGEEDVETEAPREPTFDLQVDGADAADFFRSLVAETPYNMVVHPAVEGRVSLALKSVTVSDVMHVMRDVYGYDFVLRRNVYQVFPDVLRTEIYHLNYLNVARKGRSETQVSAGKVSDTRGNGNNSDNSNNNQVDAGGDRQGSNQVVGTIVNTNAEADLWSELALTLDNIVAVDEGSSVMVTPQVGLVVVKAKPQTLRAVEDYLSRVENALSRQVVLEAKIIEVTLNEGFQAGINWHTFGDASGGTFDPTTFVCVVSPNFDSVVASSAGKSFNSLNYLIN